MAHRLLLASAVAACGLFVTQAYAGSPYYGTDNTYVAPAAGTPLTGPNAEYRATVPGEAAPAGTQVGRPDAASTPEVTFGPDGYPKSDSDPMYFRKATGTASAP